MNRIERPRQKEELVTNSPTAATGPSPWAGRVLLLSGLGIAILAIGLIFLQFGLQRLFVPWYAPILTTLAVALVVWSLARRRSATRFVVLALSAALAVFWWQFLIVGAKLPEYVGPARAGQKLPHFYTSRADGAIFSANDLEDGTPRVMTFFRGRW